MRKEYDFNRAERGKFYGRVRVVGPVRSEETEVEVSDRSSNGLQRSQMFIEKVQEDHQSSVRGDIKEDE